MRRSTLGIAGLAFAMTTLAGCSMLATPDPGSQGPSPSPVPTTGPARTVAELKYALIDGFGPLWYCDPDFYPIQRVDEIAAAREHWPDVLADTEAFAAIIAKLGFDPAASFTDERKLAVYRPWKVLRAIALDPIGNDTYRFDYLAQPRAGGAEGTRTDGTITFAGEVTVEQQAPAQQPNCPICLARGTRIDAPGGGIAVEDLRIGDTIWTLDGQDRRVAGQVLALGSTPVPVNHHVVHLVLADGRTVTASPGHPLADGRLLGELRPGDVVGGTDVASADLIPYDGTRTFDLVVSGPTGRYLVDGIALGSTIDQVARTPRRSGG